MHILIILLFIRILYVYASEQMTTKGKDFFCQFHAFLRLIFLRVKYFRNVLPIDLSDFCFIIDFLATKSFCLNLNFLKAIIPSPHYQIKKNTTELNVYH